MSPPPEPNSLDGFPHPFAHPADSDREVLEQLSLSELYRGFEQAFRKATGLPLMIRPPTRNRIYVDEHARNPLCALLAASSPTCATCLDTQERVARAEKPTSVTCYAGLRETAVPVRAGDHVVGYLQTGQVLLHRPTPERFRHLVEDLAERGCPIDPGKIERAYLRCHVVSPSQYAGVVHLLEIFANQLGSLSNQIVIQRDAGESPFLRRVKAYLADHLTDPIHLEEVARAMHVSTFYFCKLFKRATGLTFTDYLGRLRVERTKTLLLDPHRRVGEIAYEVGFGSLTHFNRVFRRLVGQSPSAYRRAASRLQSPAGGQPAPAFSQSAGSRTPASELG